MGREELRRAVVLLNGAVAPTIAVGTALICMEGLRLLLGDRLVPLVVYARDVGTALICIEGLRLSECAAIARDGSRLRVGTAPDLY